MDYKKRILCDSANKVDVSLKNCKYGVKIEKIDLPGRYADISVQRTESRTHLQIINIQDDQWIIMPDEELLKVRQAFTEHGSKRNKK